MKKEESGSAIGGLFWKFAERTGAQIVSFIVQLILARILLPDDYGVVAIITIFISLCNVFITNGLGTALVWKKNADDLDFSSVFYFSIGLSLILYIAIFFCAPWIAWIYDKPILIPTTRVLALQLFLSAVKTVQQAYVSKRLQFKKFFWSTLIGTVISAGVGIAMAVKGLGVWALIAQYLTNSLIDSFVLFLTINWKPKWKFSFSRLKPMVSYGWKLLASALVDTAYNDLRALIIGTKYSSEDLAYYNRGKQFPDLLCDNTISAVDTVLFPVMAKAQDNKTQVRDMLRRFIRAGSFLMTPLLLGLFAVADKVVILLLTDKWAFCIPYIRIYCLVNLLRPMQTGNLQVIKAVGRSDITLRIEVIKKVMGTMIILCAMPFGVYWIAMSNLLYSNIVLIINSLPNQKLIDYKVITQIRDLFPAFASGLFMVLVVWLTGLMALPVLPLLVLQVLAGAMAYICVSWFLCRDSFRYALSVIGRFFHNKKP